MIKPEIENLALLSKNLEKDIDNLTGDSSAAKELTRSISNRLVQLEGLGNERKTDVLKRVKILHQFTVTIQEFKTWYVDARKRFLELAAVPGKLQDQIKAIKVRSLVMKVDIKL